MTDYSFFNAVSIMMALCDIRQAIKNMKLKKLRKLKKVGEYYQMPDDVFVYDDDSVAEKITIHNHYGHQYDVFAYKIYYAPHEFDNIIQQLIDFGYDLFLCVNKDAGIKCLYISYSMNDMSKGFVFPFKNGILL